MMTIWVGRTLNLNGRIFLVKTFDGDEAIADSVNHLLLVGFYLINIGFVSLALKYGEKPVTYVEAIEFLSLKLGLVIVLLDVAHFFIMANLMKFRNSNIFKSLDRSDDGDDVEFETADTAETDETDTIREPNAWENAVKAGLRTEQV
tara:strand:- start:5746 stop:6186 length:441 start_codon:yes stop_codon:yes gene_type:complete